MRNFFAPLRAASMDTNSSGAEATAHKEAVSGKWNPIMILIGPAFTGKFSGLAQIRQALDSLPGVLVGSDDQEVHTHEAPIYSARRQTEICTGCLLVRLHSFTNTVVNFLCNTGET